MHSKIREILTVSAGIKHAFQDDEDVLETGAIDSMSAVRAIAALEEAFEVKIPAVEVTYENFQSVNAIANYLKGLID
ncbi:MULTISPECIES: acyl carrier protein [unclassified Ruegeria]|uniref:acyl carrier protein n=1 Tax=unclassified Ruegeria TaxID=2625375 RepID=UPI001489C59C|nr:MULTISPECIES: phosphopantetheine-binding protein [unclassified Ruegeria]